MLRTFTVIAKVTQFAENLMKNYLESGILNREYLQKFQPFIVNVWKSPEIFKNAATIVIFATVVCGIYKWKDGEILIVLLSNLTFKILFLNFYKKISCILKTFHFPLFYRYLRKSL